MHSLEDLVVPTCGELSGSQQMVPEDSQPPSPKSSAVADCVVIEDTPDKTPLTTGDIPKSDDSEINSLCSGLVASRSEIENKISELTSKLCDARKLQASQTLSFEVHI